MEYSHTQIIITPQELKPNEALSFIQSETAGASNIFISTVRNTTDGKTVKSLKFETHSETALNKLNDLAFLAIEKFDIHKIAIYHRIGELSTGEIPMVVAVSGTHHNQVMEATNYVIKIVKQSIPIWKKEIFVDGEVSIMAHP